MNRSIRLSRHQHGAIAIIVGLSIAVLVGMIGLALDLGRMFVIKSELQNAADACALAAARELDGNTDAITRADAAGILVGTRNEINFQDENAPVTNASLTYSATLSPNSAYNRSIAPATAKYVMCTVARPNVGMLFMGVRGFGTQNVSAYAVATLAPGQTTCAIPLGLCSESTDPSDPYAGLDIGQWYGGKFENAPSNPNTLCTTPSGSTSGNFNWVDFSPGPGAQPSCGNSNGAAELKCLLEGLGVCELPPINTLVGQTGVDNGLKASWNTRFGIYGGSQNANDSPPDFTGIAYTNSHFPGSVVNGGAETWPTATPGTPPNVYSGSPNSGSTPNYESAKTDRTPYQPGNPANVGGNPTVLPRTGTPSHSENGQSRRIAVAPIVNCQSFCTPGVQTVPVLGYACVLMLSPMPNNPTYIWLEYRGAANDPNSPCSSYGLGGGSGPLVPVLVQ